MIEEQNLRTSNPTVSIKSVPNLGVSIKSIPNIYFKNWIDVMRC